MTQNINDTQEYSLSYDAMVVGFILKPTIVDKGLVKELTIMHGNMLLDIAESKDSTDGKLALVTIVYAVAQSLSIDELEKKALVFFSRQIREDIDNKSLNVLLTTDFTVYKNDFMSLFEMLYTMVKVAGVQDIKKALLELCDISFFLEN